MAHERDDGSQAGVCGQFADVWGINESGQANAVRTVVAVRRGQYPDLDRSSRLRWDAENPFDETDSTHLWIVNRAASLAGQAGGADGAGIAARVQPYVGEIGDDGFHDNLCQGLL